MHITVAQILNSLNKLQPVELKDKGFVIEINDVDLYFKALIQKLKDLKLDFKREYYYKGDFMVVGIEGEKDITRTEDKPAGSYTKYSLNTQWGKIEKALEEYANAQKPLTNVYVGSIETDTDIYDYVVAHTEKKKEVIKSTTPNVYIGETFVKIGYTICPLVKCPFGKCKFFSYEGDTYRVTTNFFGVKTIELV